MTNGDTGQRFRTARPGERPPGPASGLFFFPMTHGIRNDQRYMINSITWREF